MKTVRIDAGGMHYTPLNMAIREAVSAGAREIILDNVMGQRFIADGLKGDVLLTIHGVPGGDLGMFMSGPTCIVHGNCDHAPGNTMDKGTIIIHGSAGDAIAHSMRGGKVFVRDSVGYRAGIHMKQYMDKRPVLVVGGGFRAFLGEYMAGGLILALGDPRTCPATERGIGSGIHGGKIVIRGDIDEYYLGVGARKLPLQEDGMEEIIPFVREFAGYFGLDPDPLIGDSYVQVVPSSSRPFANKYTWE
ncbi:MAG: Molybdenum-containing formylmethanofuran dehydrogenase 1 subunit C [Methanoregulaceae archaeon PtaB.Bin108]|nr:MAG: Molybdenum-containing formylmethanofuran dehydrogenase 1 subunit C [Methanoregulaceae archaeon PtaB.Bin108]